jgi:hypothetical protein
MRVVYAVHNGVCAGAHIVRSLHDIAEDEKELFPSLAHFESAMGCITMVKKSLRKQRQIPYCRKENNYRNHKKAQNLKMKKGAGKEIN